MSDSKFFVPEDGHPRPVCIMVAPNGARRTKTDHPGLPMTALELAQTAVECAAAGAAAIHLHVRDDHGSHTLDASRSLSAVQAVNAAAPDMLVQVTTEAAGICTVGEQERLLTKMTPAFASVSIAEIVRDGEQRGVGILRRAIGAGTRIQFILYSAEDIRLLAQLRASIFEHDQEPSTLLVAGRYGVVDHATEDLVHELYGTLQVEGMTRERKWMVCAFGRGEMNCLRAAILLGGHVRVGFENAIVNSAGLPLSSNAERVAELAAHIRSIGRDCLSASDAETILG